MDLKEKIKKLSPREVVIGLLALFVVVALAPYFFLYSPSRQRLKASEDRLKSLNTEIVSLSASLQSLARSAQEAEAPAITLPEANDLAGMLEAISREANRSGVDFISIAHEGFSSKGRFVEMSLKLEIRAGYRELHDFLNQMSLRHRLFLIKSLRYETNQAVYPAGVAIIRAVSYLHRA